MEPTAYPECSQQESLVEEEQQMLQGLVDELETVYSDYVSNIETLWNDFKYSTEEFFQGQVSQFQSDLANLNERRCSHHTIEEQFRSACQFISSMSTLFQRK